MRAAYDLSLLIILLSFGLTLLTSATRLVTPKKPIPKPLTPRAEDDCLDCLQQRGAVLSLDRSIAYLRHVVDRSLLDQPRA
jgi:hypothetical protein